MPIYTLEGPDGKKYRIEGPAGATAEQLASVIQGQPQQQAAPEEKGGFLQGVGNLAAGAVRGAGSIGATLLTPVDAAARAVGIENSFIGRRDRRTAMDEGLQTMGAQPESLMYKGGKIGGEIAGTAGAGGVLGNVVTRVAPAATGLATALSTGGMSAGATPGVVNGLTRVLGGAVTGGVSAGMVNPEEAGTGALIGGAIPMVAPVVKGIGSGIRKALGGTTGVGDEALKQAYTAGKTGGQAAQDFTQNMRGSGSMDDVLAAAKQNLDAMGQQKQAAYRAGMANVKADKSVLSFDGIDKAIDDAVGLTSFKGQSKNAKASQAVQAAAEEIQKWKQLNPAEFHTPEGLDALKQRLNGVLESIPFEEKTARKAVGNIYSSIKSEISKQAPEYSKVMRDYSTASETIKEIERALSLGNKAAADTSMRKLQSLMRNNVNTSYGYRDTLAKTMIDAGGNDIMPALAGQAVNEWLPRGIQRAASGTGSAGLALTGNLPAAAGMAALSSPRLIGEAMYGAGRVAGAVPNNALTRALNQGIYRGAPIVGTQ